MEERNEIALINRGKISWLYCHNVFEKRIELINRHGQDLFAFIFENNEKLHELLLEFDEHTDLKKYNNCFKHVALAIKKKKMEEV
ncbi:hypothetical protein EXN00_09770 [Clostridium botulinum]|uniref:hypothetical protein n=1 Tax=Clostridium botulinum TaxID=1491 RepID=UPI000773F380|nr:hypothetical protein [Clostridium botulinum]MBN3418601.1 hypothetical protein [Clostridium botulinum]MBN3426111.1 hypothetical protein [Clostridium botulinum]MBN3430438.1 hypothetical protein [Clostridium botulinum]NFC04724.1 hypothetical protein [Clostridium botulinum]NFC12100.1 hypothetical protein [Clostridium botulinum]